MISGTPVERVSSFKYLDVNITEDLTWTSHKTAMQRVVRLAERISVSTLLSLLEIYLKHCKSRAVKIIERMAYFGWKRKVGERVSKMTAQQFEKDSEQVDDEDVEKERADWLHVIKQRQELLLEDCAAKSKRLKDEGMLLAEQGRNWEALKRWNEAIQLTPDNAVLHEMKSQVLIALQEVFLAVQSAEMATRLRPLWWEAWQTLGRTQLSLGKVELAVRSFKVALHLHPSERSLWEEDLGWALQLREQQNALRERAKQEDEAQRLLVQAPELKSDYDFESDEVIEACTTMADRQKKYEDLKKTVVVDARGVAKEVIVKDESKSTSSSQCCLVKARGL